MKLYKFKFKQIVQIYQIFNNFIYILLINKRYFDATKTNHDRHPAIQPSKASLTQGFDPSKYTNKHMSTETVLKLKECFDLFDYDHSGQISIEEIVSTIKALGLES